MSARLHRIEDCRWFGDTATSITFHRMEEDDRFIQRVVAAAKNLDIFEGSPGRVLEIEDAFAIPGIPSIWDKHGKRIDESCVRRGPRLSQYVRNPWSGDETIEPPKEYDTVEEPLVYLSFLPNGWGHFLTESLSRLWALHEYPELQDASCFYGFSDMRSISYQKFFRYYGFKQLSRIKQFTRPIKIRKCLIPIASFSIRAEAYTVHGDAPRAVAERILGATMPERSQQPIYLSRSNLTVGRIIRHERALESRLSAGGVRVVHPETLGLEDQVRLFNTHRIFIGCWGSAFHSLVFSLAPNDIRTHVMCEDVPNSNYLMFDAILGIQANYIQALTPTPGATQVFPDLDATLDVDLMVNYLADNGILEQKASRKQKY